MRNFFLFLFCLTFSISYAQFGKNKVRYKNFKWKVYKSAHFDLYYYGKMENVVARLVDILEKTKKEYEKRFDT